MNLCSHFHDEVCYEVLKCPVCEERKDKDKEIESLKDEVANLKDEIKAIEP